MKACPAMTVCGSGHVWVLAPGRSRALGRLWSASIRVAGVLAGVVQDPWERSRRLPGQGSTVGGDRLWRPVLGDRSGEELLAAAMSRLLDIRTSMTGPARLVPSRGTARSRSP